MDPASYHTHWLFTGKLCVKLYRVGKIGKMLVLVLVRKNFSTYDISFLQIGNYVVYGVSHVFHGS